MPNTCVWTGIGDGIPAITGVESAQAAGESEVGDG
ncbi:MAG: hypothetical protein K0R17_3451 [Rariglobus sp.]|jgi:hypothetical protein|nr:hypothetical protein [Rariglobus sp.]